MDDLLKLMDNISLSKMFDVGSATWVDLTYIKDPHDFYVRPTEYRQYLSSLNAFGDHPKQSDLLPGLKVVFMSETIGTNVRGQILSVKELVCNIFAMDYGFVDEKVEIQNIYLPSINTPVPPLATRCKLEACFPLNGAKEFSRKSIDAMKFYASSTRAWMTVKAKTPEALSVTLQNSSAEDVATVMCLTGFSHLFLGDSSISIKKLASPNKLYYEHKQLKIGDKILVRALSGKSLTGFFVADVNEHKKYSEHIINYCHLLKNEDQLTVEQLVEGKPVAVADDFGRYERAFVKEITKPEMKAIVQLVDWGITKEVHIMRLKPLNSERYFQMPVTALYCTAEESQVFDNGLHKFLYPGFEFFITINDIGNKFEKPHIVKIEPKLKKRVK